MGAISFSIDPGLLQFFQQRLHLTTFVETGTYQGGSLSVAEKLFPECHSIEWSPELFQAARQQFSNRPHIHLYQGESAAMLAAQQDNFARRPVIFWLDAHWCIGPNTAGQNSQSPVLQELQAIGRLHPQSVILIDDARLYLSPPTKPHRFTDWPDFQALAAALQSLSAQHRLLVLNDVFVFYPNAIQADMTAFAHQHGVDWAVIADQARKQAAQRPKLLRQPRKWFQHLSGRQKRQSL